MLPSYIKMQHIPEKTLTSLPAAAAVCPTEWIFALTNIAQTLVEPIHWKQTWFHRPLVASRVLSEATSLFLIVNRIVSLGRVCTRHNITVSFLSPANTHNNKKCLTIVQLSYVICDNFKYTLLLCPKLKCCVRHEKLKAFERTVSWRKYQGPYYNNTSTQQYESGVMKT